MCSSFLYIDSAEELVLPLLQQTSSGARTHDGGFLATQQLSRAAGVGQYVGAVDGEYERTLALSGGLPVSG